MSKKDEKVVEEIQSVKPVESAPKKEEPAITEGGDMKIKPKVKRFEKKPNEPVKVDMTKPVEKVEKEEIPKVDLTIKEEPKEEVVVEEIKEEVTPVEKTEVEDTPVLEEITDEEKEEIVETKTEELKDEVEQAVQESQDTAEPLPENIQKVVDFMNETGGTLEEYVRLNQDYASYDQNQLLKEYYKQTKPHLNDDEISFLMEDQFSFDEESDDERDIRRKKLALKEQVANAKSHLDGLKSKYYKEIKAGVKLTSDQQKAVDFFNRYNDEQDESQKVQDHQASIFKNETSKVFNQQFKGFEYKVGEKRYRFNVKDADKIKTDQSDISNFVKKFLNKNNEMSDAAGYHKSLFTAMNPDVVANHFYEQGKADAIKDSVAKAKNVSMDPRQTHKTVESGGMKVRAITGVDSNAFKVRFNKK
tara:strand:- start:1212 stop:2462 length:1251 start_codon:yes stop_codon:yes gene_type:complete